MVNLKDLISNWVAILLSIAYAVLVYVQNIAGGEPFDWNKLIGVVVAVLISYLTGKNPDLSKKSVGQVIEQNSK